MVDHAQSVRLTGIYVVAGKEHLLRFTNAKLPRMLKEFSSRNSYRCSVVCEHRIV